MEKKLVNLMTFACGTKRELNTFLKNWNNWRGRPKGTAIRFIIPMEYVIEDKDDNVEKLQKWIGANTWTHEHPELSILKKNIMSKLIGYKEYIFDELNPVKRSLNSLKCYGLWIRKKTKFMEVKDDKI